MTEKPRQRGHVAPRTIRRLSILSSIALAAALVAACGGAGPGGPGATIDAYSDALGKQNYGAAYKLMSASFRELYTEEEFVRMMEENALEARDTAARLRSPNKELVVTAEFRFGLADTMRLVRERGTWRVASNPIQFYTQSTPREALRSFIRAYRLRRWDVMLRFVPNEYRERMTADKLREQFEGESEREIEATILRLEDSIDEPIHDNGNEARMTYGDGSEVEFIRQDGVWKIQDID